MTPSTHHHPCSAHRHPPRAFTLIEVLVALAILSMVILATFTAQRRIQRQMALATQRTQALARLDTLLETWITANTWPAADSGPIPGMPTCQWHRTDIQANLPVGARLVEIQVIETAPNAQPRTLCRVQAFKSKN